MLVLLLATLGVNVAFGADIVWTAPTSGTATDYVQKFDDNSSVLYGKSATGSTYTPAEVTSKWSMKTANSGALWIVPSTAISKVVVNYSCSSTNSGNITYGVQSYSKTGTPAKTDFTTTTTGTAEFDVKGNANKNVWYDKEFTIDVAANKILYIKFPTNVNISKITLTPASTDGGDTKSSDATLSDLKVNGATVAGFAAATETYNVELPTGTTTVPTVTATKNDTKAGDPIITNATGLPGATIVKVTAEDGTTIKTYTIYFTVASSGDPEPTCVGELPHLYTFTDWTEESFETAKTIDCLTFVGASGKSVTIEANNKTAADGTRFTVRAKFGGTGAATYRYITVPVPGPCTITLYGMSGSGGKTRVLRVDAGSFGGTKLGELSNDGNSLGTLTVDYTGAATTIYVYCTGDACNVYGIRTTAIATSHHVTYAKGEATCEITMPTQADVEEASTFTVAEAIACAGLDFLGWNDGTNTYAAGATYTMGTSDVTLTAQWQAPCTDTKPAISGDAEGYPSVVLTAGNVTAGATLQWYKDEVAIPGAEGETYTATESGSYTVKATKGCEMVSDAKAVTILANPLGSHTLQWVADKAGSLTTLKLSAKTSSSFYLTGLSDIALNGALTNQGNSNTSASMKITTTTDKVDANFVSFTFDVADGYQFTPTSIIPKVVSVSNNKTYAIEVSDTKGNVWFPAAQTTNSTAAAGTTLTFDDNTNAFAGKVTVKMWVYGATNHYRICDIAINGTVETYVAPTKHSVTYAKGDAAVTGTLPTQADVKEGATFTVAGQGDLAWEGHNFTGWNDETADYAAGATYTMGTADVILTAQWEEADPCAGFTVGCTNGPEDFSTEWLENDKTFGETTYALNVRNIQGGTAPFKYYWYKTATKTYDETTLWTENVDGIYSMVPTNNVAGTSYYYCKVVDANGCVAYSKFVSVTIAEPVDPCAGFAVTCTNGQLEPFDEWLNYERYVGATDDIWDFHATAITDGFTAAKYEWYRNTEKSYEGANLVRWNKAEDTEYTNNHSALPYVDEAGTYYYFCKVTSTGGCVAYSKYITYEVKEKAYASSIDLEDIAGNSTNNGNTPDIAATLGASDIAISTTTGATWDNNKKFADKGLKIKNSGTTISFVVEPGKLVKVVFGSTNGATFDGEELPVVNSGENEDYSLTKYYYSNEAKTYNYQTTVVTWNILKSITISDPYQVTFTNGGTIAPMTFTGTALTLPAATGEGEFQGWFDAAEGGNKIGVAGAPYTPVGDVELFAQFLNQSPNNEIASFTYGETTVTATEGKREYAIELPYKSEIPASITVTRAEEHATISEIAKDGGVFTFSVTAEHGEVANYTVTFTVAPKDGVCIIRATPTSSTAATATGLIGGTAAFRGSNNFKLSNTNDYIGVTLAEGTFQAGDIVNIYQDANVNGTTDLSVFYITLDATASSDKKLVEVANVGKRGNNYFALPAKLVDQSTFYVYRENNANCNPTFGYMEVLRPMAPVVTGATILGEAATINEAAKTVSIEVAFSADITAVTPVFEFVSNDNAQVVVTPAGAQDFTKAKTYRFTDKDGDYTEYVVSITKAEASHDATLSSITVAGVVLEGFVAENTSYTYVREYGDDVIPAVEGLKNHAGATVVSTTEGNVVTLTVTAEDNTTEKVYTITFNNKPQPAAAPTIATQPASHDYIDTEDIAALTVEATVSDAGVLSYQWYKGEEPVGENLSTYTPTEAGSYKVVVTNTLGEETATVTSEVAVITVRHIYTFEDWTTGATFTKAGEWTLYPYNKDNRWLTEEVKFSANQRIDEADAAKKATIFNDQYFVVKFEKAVEKIVIANYYSGSDRYINEIYTLVPGNPELGDKGKGTATPITSDFDITYTGRSSSSAKVTTTTITKKDDSEKLFEKDIYYVFKMSGTGNAIYDFIVTAAPEQMAAPAVNTTLVDETICAEDNFAMLNAVTAEEATYSYQWFKDEEVIAEATAASFTPTESGVYYCHVTNHADGYRDNEAKTNKVTLVRLTSGTEITDHSETNVRLEEGQSATLSVTATGKGEISYAWFTCDDANGTNPVAIENEDEPTYRADFAAGVQYIMAQVSGDCGTTSIVFIVSEKIDLPQRDVTASTTWDWAAFDGGKQNIGFANQTDEFLFANVSALVPNNTTFPSDQLVGKGQWVWRTNENHFQGRKLSFHTTIGGKVKVNYRSTGTGKTVSVTINGKSAGSRTNSYGYSDEIIVLPGDVVIEFGGAEDTRINKVVFTSIEDLADTDFNYVRDCGLGAMTTTCLPKNVPAGCFTGATFYETSYFVRGNNGLPYKIYFDEVTELKAGYPYLVVMNEGETTFRVLYGEEEAPAPQNENGFYGVYTSFDDGAKGTVGNILEGNYIVYNNEVRLCGGYCGLNDNRAYIIMDGGEKSVRTTDPAPAGTSARRRVALGNPAAAPATTTALDYLTEDGSAHKVMIDSQLYIIRDGKMYNVNGVLVK